MNACEQSLHEEFKHVGRLVKKTGEKPEYRLEDGKRELLTARCPKVVFEPRVIGINSM